MRRIPLECRSFARRAVTVMELDGRILGAMRRASVFLLFVLFICFDFRFFFELYFSLNFFIRSRDISVSLSRRSERAPRRGRERKPKTKRNFGSERRERRERRGRLFHEPIGRRFRAAWHLVSPGALIVFITLFYLSLFWFVFFYRESSSQRIAHRSPHSKRGAIFVPRTFVYFCLLLFTLRWRQCGLKVEMDRRRGARTRARGNCPSCIFKCS